MKTCFVFVLCGMLSAINGIAQEVFSSVYTTTAYVGPSALSVDSIPAKTVHIRFPVYDVVADTAYSQLIFSCRQPGEGTQTYLNKSGFAALSYSGDTISWKNETALYDISLTQQHLLVSGEKRSVDFNRRLGYDEQHFDARIAYAVPWSTEVLIYKDPKTSELSCVDVVSGDTKWTTILPREENWADIKKLNDSVVLIASAGLRALNLKSGELWSYPMSTAITTTGSLIYSPANPRSLKLTGSGVITAVEDNLITQLSSNILIAGQRIYYGNRQSVFAVDSAGKKIWETDLRDYDPAKMVLTKIPQGILLANFGLGVHAGNFVVVNSPFVLLLDSVNGTIIDQYGLSEIGNLIDFSNDARGLGFAGKNMIVEIRNNDGFYKSRIKLDIFLYGQFHEFINGDQYHIFKEGYYVPLNFIDDQLVYFRADNNKIYGISGERLMYEYHFTELYKILNTTADRRILVGPKETLVTSRNFELHGLIKLAEKRILLKNKLYFIDQNKIHIVDLDNIR